MCALLSPPFRMLYTDLLKLWDESVQAVDAKDWKKALKNLEQIQDPTSRILFNAASVYVALGQLDQALKVGFGLHFCQYFEITIIDDSTFNTVNVIHK